MKNLSEGPKKIEQGDRTQYFEYDPLISFLVSLAAVPTQVLGTD